MSEALPKSDIPLTVLNLPEGRVQRLVIPSSSVQGRNVDIWVPDDYDPYSDRRYAVLYMQDGQNVFDPKTAFTGVTWEAGATIARLSRERRIKDTLIAAIWNSPDRIAEYIPQKPFESLPKEWQERTHSIYPMAPLGDAYLRFIVESVKPQVDAAFRTHPDRLHTFIHGSSLGGLTALYALCEYPDVFGGAACISSHWPLLQDGNRSDFRDTFIRYLDAHLPEPNTCKVYFDYGTETMDALYDTHHYIVGVLMRAKGFTSENWITRRFDGEPHHERAWKSRFHVPIEFFLGTGVQKEHPTNSAVKG